MNFVIERLGKKICNRPSMPIMTRDKTGTSRDKTGTSRDRQGQNRDSRISTFLDIILSF